MKANKQERRVVEMDNAKIDYILDIFKTLTNELPEQMLFRENGDSLELKTLDGIGNGLLPDLQNNGWSLINSQLA
jgi:hypothetical protein